MLQYQEEDQQRSAEWCQHDPIVIIHHKNSLQVESEVTFFGLTTQAVINMLGSPHGLILSNGNLEIRLRAPGFPWAVLVETVLGPHRQFVAHQRFGNDKHPLAADRDLKVWVDLP